MSTTIEQTFAEEFYRSLERKIQQKVEMLALGSADNYSEYTRIVGAVRELEEIKEEFGQLLGAYFPTYKGG